MRYPSRRSRFLLPNWTKALILSGTIPVSGRTHVHEVSSDTSGAGRVRRLLDARTRPPRPDRRAGLPDTAVHRIRRPLLGRGAGGHLPRQQNLPRSGPDRRALRHRGRLRHRQRLAGLRPRELRQPVFLFCPSTARPDHQPGGERPALARLRREPLARAGADLNVGAALLDLAAAALPLRRPWRPLPRGLLLGLLLHHARAGGGRPERSSRPACSRTSPTRSTSTATSRTATAATISAARSRRSSP